MPVVTVAAMGESSPSAVSARERVAPALAIIGAAALIAALTAVVFLVRAGAPDSTAWPIHWELENSDNGVLFQVVQDAFAGRSLDWSFSPQVYVFPELPISTVAYVLAGGWVQAYFLFVAALNNAVLFLGMLLLVRLLYPAERLSIAIGRASIAMFPLLLLPLLGTSSLQSYHLAPTYYFGMYLLVIAAPSFFLVRSTRSRVLLGTAIALTAASNPLALVFCVPPLVLVLLVKAFKTGFRSIRRPAIAAGILLAGALVIRITLFSRLQGTSPLTYIDYDVFLARLGDIQLYFESMVTDTTTRNVLFLGAVGAVLCLAFAIAGAVRHLRAHPASVPSDRWLVALYFGFVPLAGLAGTAMLLITHSLYSWLVLIAPLVFVLLPMPRAWVSKLLPAGAAVLVAAGLLTGAVPNLASAGGYFSYRSAETRCLDARLPDDVTLGYSTFSDARRLSLTSDRPFRLAQIMDNAQPSYWLTNRSYMKTEGGQFFYVNESGAEDAIDMALIERLFGAADSRFTCGEDATVLVYSDPEKLAAIKKYYNENTGT